MRAELGPDVIALVREKVESRCVGMSLQQMVRICVKGPT